MGYDFLLSGRRTARRQDPRRAARGDGRRSRGSDGAGVQRRSKMCSASMIGWNSPVCGPRTRAATPRWRRPAARATTEAPLSRPAVRPSTGRSFWVTPARRLLAGPVRERHPGHHSRRRQPDGHADRAGLIASMSDFWLTSAGLAICETHDRGYERVQGLRRDRVPEFVRARKARSTPRHRPLVETLNTDNNGGYANSWLIGDVNAVRSRATRRACCIRASAARPMATSGATTHRWIARIRNLECLGTGFQATCARPTVRGKFAGANCSASTTGTSVSTSASACWRHVRHLPWLHPSSARNHLWQSDVDPCHSAG